MNYLLHIITMLCLYFILAQSLNIILGYCGLLSLCHAAMYGLGAYTSAILMLELNSSYLVSVIIAMIVTGLIAWVLSFPAMRFHDDFFVLITLGIQMITFSILYNWTDLTKGPYGISGIPRPSLFGITANSPSGFAALAFILAMLVLFITQRLVHSPYGRVLQAVRDDENAARSLGKNVSHYKRSAFVVAGILAALAGALYASYASYIDPTSFTIDESIFIVCVVIIGGAGNIRGPIVGSVILVLLPEILRIIHIPDLIAPNLRQILYGLLIVLLMRLRPQGVAGQYAFD